VFEADKLDVRPKTNLMGQSKNAHWQHLHSYTEMISLAHLKRIPVLKHGTRILIESNLGVNLVMRSLSTITTYGICNRC
jgi:hypothetical protein